MPSLQSNATAALLVTFLLVGAMPAAFAADLEPPILHEYRDRAMTNAEVDVVVRLAEGGNGKAQLVLGEAYLNGEGVLKDDAQGVRWLSKAAHSGYTKEVYSVAESVFFQGRDPAQRDLAKRLFKVACDAGDLRACDMLGSTIIEDKGNIEEGLAYLRKAAEMDDAGAQLSMAEFLSGMDIFESALVPKDEREALRWGTRSAEHGNGRAMRVVGKLYENGKGVAQDYEAAWHWYERGVAIPGSGCDMALAELYEFGRGVPQNGPKALAIYKAIAATGIQNAHPMIGRIYEFGRGVPQDYAEAFKWYDAVPGGLGADHAYALGLLCEEGKVVPRDVEKARMYYTVSRTAEAAFRLGESFANEPEPYQDRQEAVTWLLVAKGKGNSQTETLLAKLDALVSDEQRARAAAKAKEWLDEEQE